VEGGAVPDLTTQNHAGHEAVEREIKKDCSGWVSAASLGPRACVGTWPVVIAVYLIGITAFGIGVGCRALGGLRASTAWPTAHRRLTQPVPRQPDASAIIRKYWR
jgi:hypothetical protein